MKKFRAVTYDAYREAMNSWVIPAMLVLSGLVVLFIGSISFRPIDLKTEVEKQLYWLNFFMSISPNSGSPQYVVENLKMTPENVEPWNAAYEFDVALRGGNKQFFDQISGDPNMPITPVRTRNFFRATMPYAEDLEVNDRTEEVEASRAAVAGGVVLPMLVESGLPEKRFHVSISGTNIEDRLAWLHEPTVLFFWKLPISSSLRQGVYTLQKLLINDAGAWVILLVAVVFTAGFIPNMLQKGTLDLYIAKPIGRVELLLYKYLGGLIVVLLLATATVGGVWLMIGLRTGLWGTNFLLLIPVLTFYFAVLYAVSTLAAVLTRSPLVAIITTLVAWGIFFGIGWGYQAVTTAEKAGDELEEKIREAIEESQSDLDGDIELPKENRPWELPRFLTFAAKATHAVCPRTYELDSRMADLIARGVLTENELKQRKGSNDSATSWAEILGVSTAFILVLLTVAAVRFRRMDG